ncbi:MAG TPA: alpha/beta hydrolase [Polyangia bacterium]|nr:alpha/beta hydrolase [Polyangia bacterium]
MTAATPATTRMADGRTLAFCQWGDPEGSPVFSLHGTPGSRLTRHPDEEVYRRAGVRAITYDRAGYGGSTRLPGRSIAHAATDVAAIADALGIDRFAVTGGSGGAPHALSCGTLLPGRVTRCASVVGPAPYGAAGLERDDWLHGMVEGNVREFELSLTGEEALRPELQRETTEMLTNLGRDPDHPMGEGYDLSPSDLEMVARTDIREMLDASLKVGCGETIDGFVDDDLSTVAPWGFDPTVITVPVAVWYGVSDTLVPPAHGEWLAQNLPGAAVVRLDGGHFASYDRLGELLAWLTESS